MVRNIKIIQLNWILLSVSLSTLSWSAWATDFPCSIPVSDAEWEQISRSTPHENYKIHKGDTLSQISQRLFGSCRYWSRIWTINRKIKDPDQILTGSYIKFVPKSSSPVNSQKTQKTKIQDYSLQKPLGFDSQVISSSEKLKAIGKITGGNSETNRFSLNNIIYIKTDETLQAGDVYAITSEPTLLKSPTSERTGYSYPLLGRVQILDAIDNLFLGRIMDQKGIILREQTLVASPPFTPFLKPIPGPQPLRGTLFMGHQDSTSPSSTQYQEVYVDLGSHDGLQPGMIFGIGSGTEIHENTDPSNDKKMTEKDFIAHAHMMVTRTTETFATGVVIQSSGPLQEGSPMVLLTDLTDFMKKYRSLIKNINHGKQEQRETTQPTSSGPITPVPTSAPVPNAAPTSQQPEAAPVVNGNELNAPPVDTHETQSATPSLSTPGDAPATTPATTPGETAPSPNTAVPRTISPSPSPPPPPPEEPVEESPLIPF